MLTLAIKSFSYKKGIPAAIDSHGGGYVFDCRALPNPGREASYQMQTGKDQAVKDYINSQPGTELFWQNVSGLIQQSVKVYKSRGFNSLSVYFGCTGGQHRSVYFAERLAALFADDAEVKVLLEHTNLPIGQ